MVTYLLNYCSDLLRQSKLERKYKGYSSHCAWMTSQICRDAMYHDEIYFFNFWKQHANELCIEPVRTEKIFLSFWELAIFLSGQFLETEESFSFVEKCEKIC